MTTLSITLSGQYDNQPYYVGDDVIVPFDVTLPEDLQLDAVTIKLQRDNQGNGTYEDVADAVLTDQSNTATSNSFRLSNVATTHTSEKYRLSIVKTEDAENTHAESSDFALTVEENTAAFNHEDIKVTVNDNQLDFTIAINSSHNDLVYTWKADSRTLGTSASASLDRVEADDQSEPPTITLELKANQRRGTYRLTKTITRKLTAEEYRKAKAEEEAMEEEEEAASGEEEVSSGASDSSVTSDVESARDTESEDYASSEEENYLETHYALASQEEIVSSTGHRTTLGLRPTKALPESAHARFVWKKDGAVLNAYTESSLIFASPVVTDTGVYTLEATITTPKQATQSKEYRFNLVVSEPEASEDTDEEEASPSSPELGLSQTNLGIVHELDMLVIRAVGLPENVTSLQWYGIGLDGVEAPLPGMVNDTLNYRAVPEVGKGVFLRVTAGVEIKDTPHAVISSFTPANIVVSSLDEKMTVEERGRAEYSISVTPDDKHTRIEWYFENNSGVTSHLVANSGQKQLTIEPVALQDSGRYYAVVSRLTTPQVRSRALTLTVQEVETPIEFEINLNRESIVKLPAGSIFNISATVRNATDATTYQWFKKTAAGTAIVPNAESPVLTLEDIAEDDTGHYALVVTQGISQTQSDWVFLDVIEKPAAITIQPPAGLTPEGADPNEAILSGRQYDPAVAPYAAAIDKYCQAMYAGNRMTIEDGVIHQTALFRNIVKILNIQNYENYMNAMDMLIDYFYTYRETVFRIDLRARFLSNITEDLMSTDEIEAFNALLPVLAYMADPVNNLPQSLREIGDVIVDQIAWARLQEYFDRKVETRLEASLLSSEELLASRVVG